MQFQKIFMRSTICILLLHICALPSNALELSQSKLSQTVLQKLVDAVNQTGNAKQNFIDALPDGGVVKGTVSGIKVAYYTGPTKRYGHGILGDRIEATTINAIVGDKAYSTILKSDVFEDITPKLADLDGDGLEEIITLQTSQTKGGSLAIYGVENDQLIKLAQTPYIGTSNRWMNVAGIADFNADGLIEIALVDRPHIRGELEFWTYTKSKKLELRIAKLGYSNHFIGSRAQNLSAVVKLNGKNLLALPTNGRRSIDLIDASGNKIESVASFPLSDKIAHNIGKSMQGDITSLGLKLENGTIIGIDISP